MLKNGILDAKIYEDFAKIWQHFGKIFKCLELLDLGLARGHPARHGERGEPPRTAELLLRERLRFQQPSSSGGKMRGCRATVSFKFF